VFTVEIDLGISAEIEHHIKFVRRTSIAA